MERSPSLSPPMGPPPRERMIHLRLMLLALAISLWGLVIAVRLVDLQVLERSFFERHSARQSERTINLDPRRGPILDRNGRPLAVSVEAESIYAVPQDIEDPARTAAALGKALGLDAGSRRDLAAQLQKNRAFLWVKRKADPGTARAVRELSLDGVGFLNETRRYYPQRELMSQVLGYVGLDNTGMSGVEYAFEDLIQGRAEKVVVQTDARRRPTGHTKRPSTDGHTVVLALDESIQHAAERELERAVVDTQSEAGVVVVADPWTGEVLAMANWPTFNPNRFGAYPSAHWRNRAVSDAYEPGSIFKIVTAAAGIQERAVSTEEILDCGNGGIEIAGVRINDHAVFDKLSFRMAVAKSSDVGMIRVAQRLGRDNLNRYMREFGFGAPTGIDLPGESSGLLRPLNKWSAISLASLSFGQEVGVTALQMTMAAASVANGGYLMKPLVVKEIQSPSGDVVQEMKPVATRRVLEPQTVDVLTEILTTVVREGTGRRAAIPGFTVAGKTGTAQKIDPSGRYSMIDHVASFVGFVPVRQPAFVILVSLDTPKGPRNQGGDIAAPLFARIAEHALRYRAIPPDDPERVLRVVAEGPVSLTPVAYRPEPPVTARSTPPLPTEPGLMPDLRGQSAREAAQSAARRGLIVELRGSGNVVGQIPEPGSEIEEGMTGVLTLDRPGPGSGP